MQSTSKTPQSRMPKAIRAFWALNVCLGAFSLIWTYVSTHIRHVHDPYTFPFSLYGFSDLLRFAGRFQHLHSREFFAVGDPALNFMYPAPVALLYEGFYLTHHALWAFFLVCGILTAALGVMLGGRMVREGLGRWITALFLLTTLAVSYPFWFEALLGNMEFCIFLIVAFGVLAVLGERYYLGASLIGLAASMKIFPFVFIALLISRRKYWAVVYAAIVAAIANLFSLWLVCPDLRYSYAATGQNLREFSRQYMLRFLPVETGFDHSIFGFFKAAARVHFHWIFPVYLLQAYLAVAALTGIAVYLIWIRKLPILNQVLCLYIASILLPPTSHDYTLLHLYVPWGLIVLYALQARGVARAGDGLWMVFICFALLFSPESEIVVRHTALSGQFKAIVLVVLFVLGVRHKLPSSLDEARIRAGVLQSTAA